MSTLKIGIIGAGFGARVHLPAFRSLDDVAVVAVADAGSGGARAAMSGATYFDDWRALLTTAPIDAVDIAVPPREQAPIALAALAAGRHVLCEKPFGLRLADAEAMCAACQRTGLVGMVNFQLRYEPAIARLREEITAGAVGTLRRVDVSWETDGRADASLPWSWQHDAAQGGGVITGFFSHVVDLVSWLTATEIEAIFGQSAILIARRPDSSGTLTAVTAEDRVDATMRMSGGVVSTVRITNCQPGGGGLRIDVAGDSGILVCRHKPPRSPDDWALERHTRSSGPTILPLPTRGSAAGFDPRIHAERLLAGTFVAAVRNSGRREGPGFSDGLKMRRVLATLDQSVQSRREVAVPAAVRAATSEARV